MGTEPAAVSKVCTKCGSLRPLDAFYARRRARDGRSSHCRTCAAEATRTWRNKPGIAEAQKHVRRLRFGWEPAGSRPKKTSEQRRAVARHSKAAWREKNRDLTRQWCRAANAKRRATPAGSLNHRISSSIYQTLKAANARKAGRAWEALVGFTIDELIRHLERQFLPGMSWGNLGKWHVDHIIPLASFEFSGPDDPDFKAAWRLTNLRPLWALANMQKRDQRQTLL